MYKNKTTRLILLLGIILYIFLNYIILFFDDKIILKLTHEDGVIEDLGALYFFISSILFLILFKLSKEGNNFRLFRTKKNIFYLLLGMAFFFAFGEEISWGQRIFNIHVPKAWEVINVQKELTIHNLIFFQEKNKSPFFSLTNMDTWFTAFSLGFCFLTPLINKMFVKVSRQLRQIRLPIVPIEIGIVFLITYLIFMSVKFFSHAWAMGHAASEIRESIWAFLYLIIAASWIDNARVLDKKGRLFKFHRIAKNTQ